jgi:hypothetical protein
MENSQGKQGEEHEQKLKAARWLAGLMDVVVVGPDGTPRQLEGEEAVAAIIRQWDAEEAG